MRAFEEAGVETVVVLGQAFQAVAAGAGEGTGRLASPQAFVGQQTVDRLDPPLLVVGADERGGVAPELVDAQARHRGQRGHAERAEHEPCVAVA